MIDIRCICKISKYQNEKYYEEKLHKILNTHFMLSIFTVFEIAKKATGNFQNN
jgi:hypothetical protein